MRKREIEELIYNGRLYDAIKGIRAYSEELPYPFHLEKIADIETTYRQMLSYAVQGVRDDKRDEIVTFLKRSLLEEMDELRREQGIRISGEQYYVTMKILAANVDSALRLREPLLQDPASLVGAQRKVFDNCLEELFDTIWVSHGIDDDILSEYSQASDYVRQSIASAMTMALMYLWDETKVKWILSELTREDLSEGYLVRLAFAFVVAATLYDKRLSLYDKEFGPLLKKVSDMVYASDDEGVISFSELLEMLYSDYLIATETSDLTHMLEKKMPGIQAQSIDVMRQSMEEGLESGIEGIMADEDLRSEMERIARLEQEGYDTRYALFRNFKRFPFFRSVGNWLIPFDIKHSAIVARFEETGGDAVRTLTELFHNVVCDSDLYSALLGYHSFNITYNGSAEDLNRALDEKREMEGEAKHNDRKRIHQAIHSYFQCFYRLVKLYPFSGRRLFNFFDNLLVPDMIVLRPYLPNYNHLAVQAIDLLMNKKKYKQVIQIVEQLHKSGTTDRNLLIRSGHAHYQLNEYIDAIKSYEHADLIGDLDADSIIELALSYRSVGLYKKATELLSELREKDKENPELLLRLAATFLEMQCYDMAKPLLYEYEFKSSRPERVLRPMAWTLFMLKEYVQSEAYYNKMEHKNSVDCLNQGYLMMAMGRYTDAVTSFREAFALQKGDSEAIYQMVADDEAVLLVHKITCHDVWLLLDAVSMKA